jgi:hypothetical protein
MAERNLKDEALCHLRQLLNRAKTDRIHTELWAIIEEIVGYKGKPHYVTITGLTFYPGTLAELQRCGFEVEDRSAKDPVYDIKWSAIKRPLMVPTVHLNGTSRDSLLEGYKHAANAVRDAIIALDEAAPHGRDYYPQGKGSIDQAIQEHRERMLKLADVISELEQIAQAIAR